MKLLNLIQQLAGIGNEEPLIRILTRDDYGKVVKMQAAKIRLVSGTGDIVIEANELKDEKP